MSKSKYLALTAVPVAGRGDLAIGVRIEDVNGDGKPDVVFSVAGADVYRITATTLAKNIADEFGRVVKKIKKATSKKGKSK